MILARVSSNDFGPVIANVKEMRSQNRRRKNRQSVLMLRRGFSLLEKVPDVFAMYGWEGTVVFASHPGVMAISKLLEQKSIVSYRATFDQDIIDEMKAFDEELPGKPRSHSITSSQSTGALLTSSRMSCPDSWKRRSNSRLLASRL